MNRLLVARIVLVLGLGIGLISFFATVSHIGSERYLLVPGVEDGEAIIQTHAWYHALREVVGDVASMVVLLLIFFGAVAWRTPVTWTISLIIMVGYYAPFWIGTPFSPALAAPSWAAELVHLVMAILPFGALFIAKRSFWDQPTDE